MRRVLLAIGLTAAVLVPSNVRAQAIVVAPTALVIQGATRSGALTLINAGDVAAELTLSTTFGYPATDSAGRMFLQTFDVVDDSLPSAESWLKIYPRQLRLAPGERRTVRVLASPPAGVRDGEYWARLVVASRAAETAPDTTAATSVRIGLALEVRQVIGVFVRQGHVATNVTVDAPSVAIVGDSLVARVPLVRGGNAAFVGSLRATLVNPAGIVYGQAVLPLGVYYGLTPRVSLPLAGVPSGRMSLRLEAMSERPDVPPGALLKARTARRDVELDLPPIR